MVLRVITGTLIAVAFGYSAAAYETAGENVPFQPLSVASVVIPAQDPELEGDTVRFTVPKNAASLDRRAKSAISVVALADKPSEASCPFLKSTSVRKDVSSYNPFTGRATVEATFSEARFAKLAVENGCVLIDDR